MIPDPNPYNRGPNPSPLRKSSVDMESASLLDEETRAMRAKVIAHLVLPIPAGGGLSLNRLVTNLHERVESSCENIYRDGKPVPEIISAKYIHIHSWLGYKADIFQEVPKGSISPEDARLSHLLHLYKHDVTSRGGPISPEYAAYYKARRESESAYQTKAMSVNSYIDEFNKTHKLEELAKLDVAELVLNVWQTVAVNHHSPDDVTDPWKVPSAGKKPSSTVAAQMEAGTWFFERFKRKPPMTSRRRPNSVARTWSFDGLPGMGNGGRHRDIDDL